jgi:NADH-quinone oxidoreductase subunit C
MNVSTVSDSSALVASLQKEIPGATFEAAPSVDLQTTIYASRDDVPAVARALWDRPEWRYTLLVELTAVDYHPREPRFELVYLLVSLEHRHRLRLKVRLQGNAARVPTVTGVWPAANWLEREVVGSLRLYSTSPRPAAAADAGGLGRLSTAQGLSGADSNDAARERAVAGHRAEFRANLERSVDEV